MLKLLVITLKYRKEKKKFDMVNIVYMQFFCLIECIDDTKIFCSDTSWA